MINPAGKKLEKIVNKLFDEAIEGVDRYNNNGSLWLIFTDEMRWVVEYTKGQTLWYNYNFFRNEMELVGLDCVENKDLIQKWFESRFLNANEVKVIDDYTRDLEVLVEDTIQNGVKRTLEYVKNLTSTVEDTIQNGVKLTVGERMNRDYSVKDIVENGIKNTYSDILPQEYDWSDQFDVEETIQNGVKYAFPFAGKPFDEVNGIIQNGVRHTMWSNDDDDVNDAIKNGEKIELK
jgi:hypothetical protein